jgi:endonuclease/exonuclease/phosphatase (EEP) superfamily protein YafD
VVTFNVLRENTRHEEVLKFLRSTDPDLVALIETDPQWIDALAPLESTHPHLAQHPASHNFGMALYSKFPIIRYRRPMPTPGLPLLVVDLDHHGSLLTVVVAHPAPPLNHDSHRARDHYFAEAAKHINQTRAPAILMGDFNATPWSPVFADLINNTGLQDSGKGRGFQSTWKRFNPLFTIPIDHVLHTDALEPVHRFIGPACGSDHSPVVVDFAFTAETRRSRDDVPPDDVPR